MSAALTGRRGVRIPLADPEQLAALHARLDALAAETDHTEEDCS